jgi:hypothetical protein
MIYRHGRNYIPKLTILFIQKIVFKKKKNLFRKKRYPLNELFNVYGYRLKSTDIVVMKDITDFKDIRHQTGLSNT